MPQAILKINFKNQTGIHCCTDVDISKERDLFQSIMGHHFSLVGAHRKGKDEELHKIQGKYRFFMYIHSKLEEVVIYYGYKFCKDLVKKRETI